MRTSAMTTFAENVKQRLSEYGWSHQDLANAIGMERTHVSRALRGSHSPRLVFIERVAEALELDVQDLFKPVVVKERVA